MKRSAIVILTAWSLSHTGCFDDSDHAITHIVVVWLKDHGNPAHIKRVIEETRALRSIPGVSSLRVGPCIESDRSIVDSSFDVAITMTFKSKEAMKRYIEHPKHAEMVKTELMPLVERIRVFDFRNQP